MSESIESVTKEMVQGLSHFSAHHYKKFLQDKGLSDSYLDSKNLFRNPQQIVESMSEMALYEGLLDKQYSGSNNYSIADLGHFDPLSESYSFAFAFMGNRYLPWSLPLDSFHFEKVMEKRLKSYVNNKCQDDTFNDSELFQWSERNKFLGYYGLLKGCLTVNPAHRLTINDIDTLLGQLLVIQGYDVTSLGEKYNKYLELISAKLEAYELIIRRILPKGVRLSREDSISSEDITKACVYISSQLNILSKQKKSPENTANKHALIKNKVFLENILPMYKNLEKSYKIFKDKKIRIEKLVNLMSDVPVLNFNEEIKMYDFVKGSTVSIKPGEKSRIFWEAYFFAKKNDSEIYHGINALNFAHLIYLIHFSDNQQHIDTLVDYISEQAVIDKKHEANESSETKETTKTKLISFYKMYIAMRESKVNQLMSIDAAKSSIISMLEKLGYRDAKKNVAKYRKVIATDVGKGRKCLFERKSLIGNNLAESLVAPRLSKLNQAGALLRTENEDEHSFFKLPKAHENTRDNTSHNHIFELRKLKLKEKSVFDHRKKVLSIMQDLVNYVQIKHINCMNWRIWDFSWSNWLRDIFYKKRFEIMSDFMKFINSEDECEYENVFEYYVKVIDWLKSKKNDIEKVSKTLVDKLAKALEKLEVEKEIHQSQVTSHVVNESNQSDHIPSSLVTCSMLHHQNMSMVGDQHAVVCQ